MCAPRSQSVERQPAQGRSLEGERAVAATKSTPTIPRASRQRSIAPLVVAFHNGAPVRLAGCGQTSLDSVPRTRRTSGLFNGQPAVDGADQPPIAGREHHRRRWTAIKKQQLPGLQARRCPSDIHLQVVGRADDARSARRSPTWRSAWLIATVLVIAGGQRRSLRSWRATIVPAVAIVASLMGTLAVRCICWASRLDNLSLMALTLWRRGSSLTMRSWCSRTSARHVEERVCRRSDAALQRHARGRASPWWRCRSASIAVFIPLLFFGGIVGRLFFEFAMTLTLSVILFSLIVSLTDDADAQRRGCCKIEHRPSPRRSAAFERAVLGKSSGAMRARRSTGRFGAPAGSSC